MELLLTSLMWFGIGWVIGWLIAEIQSIRRKKRDLEETRSVCYEITDTIYQAIQQEANKTFDQYKKWMEETVDEMDYMIEDYFDEKCRPRLKKRIFK